MISSCADCTTKCCRSGPGPYRKVPAREWLEVLEGSAKYNAACENYIEDTGMCKVWGTPEIPMICKTFVCGIRTYTKEELEDIDFWLKLVAKAKPKL